MSQASVGKFGGLDRDDVELLRRHLGTDKVIDRAEELIACSVDGSTERGRADLLVYPACTADVAHVCRLCTRRRVPLYARGAGTNLSGGAFPLLGGVVLDFTRMNRIISVNSDDLTAVVEPGVTTGDLKNAVGRCGLFYPPDPASYEYTTIGGNVAECAGGISGVKYGVTRDYVLGMEVVLADGRILRLGRGTLKNVAGYDLVRLFVGSEGTLALVTEITVKLLPCPGSRKTLLAAFPDSASAAEASFTILRKHILPRALEFIDRRCTDCVRRYQPGVDLPENVGALLLVEVDGDRSAVQREADEILSILNGAGPMLVRDAKSEEESESLWNVRRAVSPSLYKISPFKLNEDICVPRSKVLEFLERVEKKAADYPHIQIVHFGHIGDGNLHCNVLFGREREARAEAEQAVEFVLKLASGLGGSISGEHGIGTRKSAYLSLEFGPAEMEVMRRVKALFDPEGILNPGKMFPLQG